MNSTNLDQEDESELPLFDIKITTQKLKARNEPLKDWRFNQHPETGQTVTYKKVPALWHHIRRFSLVNG